MRWNQSEVGELYHDLAVSAGWAETTSSAAEASQVLADRFIDLLKMANMPTALTELASERQLQENLKTLAQEAAQQWTGTFNPRKMEVADFQQVYRNAMQVSANVR